ncbi:MAG: BrnT family toxin [Bryobacterales bacterium]|nr:BrnT family toxin [Bryobacterales bacterium]
MRSNDFRRAKQAPLCARSSKKREKLFLPGCTLVHVAAFEWDARKAASNVRKHGTRFADAVAVLEDERAITVRDDAHGEERWVTIGVDALARILTVAYTWRGKAIRLISARPATPNERRQYLENI